MEKNSDDNSGSKVTLPAQPQSSGEGLESYKAKIESMEQQMGEMRTFIEDANTVIQAVYTNPDLVDVLTGKKKVANATPAGTEERAPAPQSKTAPVNEPPKPQLDPRVDDMIASTRSNIIDKVEANMGIQRKSPEERKAIRQSVERKLNALGTSVLTQPVSSLESVLLDAYTLVEIPNAKEEGRLEALAEARNNQAGAFPGIGGASYPDKDKGEVVLTETQKEWAEKLGADKDRVKDMLSQMKESGSSKVIPYQDRSKKE